jgi:hypothetical protein
MRINRTMRSAVLAAVMMAISAAAFAQIGISVRIGPPVLPVYAQPICPGPGYLWTPGYWGYAEQDGYYWVPGTWVGAPVGLLWTPGYWGWGGGFYRWNGGYWGPHVGFYGGINYGFGYGGVGFGGGYWRNNAFFYNRSVTNVNVTNVTNVYNRTVVVSNTRNVSFNGGNGGINARPTRDEERWSREPHTRPIGAQTEHEQAAGRNRELFASVNHGRPAIAATARPGEFSGRGVVAARNAERRDVRGGPAERKVTPPNAGNRAAENRAGENKARGNERREPNRPNAERPAAERPHNEARPAAAERPHSEARPAAAPRRAEAPKENHAKPEQPRREEERPK